MILRTLAFLLLVITLIPLNVYALSGNDFGDTVNNSMTSTINGTYYSGDGLVEENGGAEKSESKLSLTMFTILIASLLGILIVIIVIIAILKLNGTERMDENGEIRLEDE